MIPGTAILVQGVFERRIGSALEARIGADLVRIVEADLAPADAPDPSPRRYVRYRGDGERTVWRVLCADGDTLFIRSGRLHAIACESWVEDVTLINRNAA